MDNCLKAKHWRLVVYLLGSIYTLDWSWTLKWWWWWMHESANHRCCWAINPYIPSTHPSLDLLLWCEYSHSLESLSSSVMGLWRAFTCSDLIQLACSDGCFQASDGDLRPECLGWIGSKYAWWPSLEYSIRTKNWKKDDWVKFRKQRKINSIFVILVVKIIVIEKWVNPRQHVSI